MSVIRSLCRQLQLKSMILPGEFLPVIQRIRTRHKRMPSKNTNWKIIWQVRLSLAENLSVRFTPMNFWD